jgi:hypothetical protein
VTGKIFVWLDEDSESVTTGWAPTLFLPTPEISVSQSLTQGSTGANETLSYTTDGKRSLSTSSVITTESGTRLVSWTQSLSATNFGLYTGYGAVQQNNQSTIGTDQSTGRTFYKSSYAYPLYAETSYFVQSSGNFTIGATVIRALELSIQGTPVFPTGLQPFTEILHSAPLISGFSGTSLSTTQNGSAYYFASPSAGISSGFGSTSQEFSFKGIDVTSGATVVL